VTGYHSLGFVDFGRGISLDLIGGPWEPLTSGGGESKVVASRNLLAKQADLHADLGV
jgi:hypothetical protein